MAIERLAQRKPRITNETTASIVRLAIHQVPQAEIARRTGVHRQTVKRVLERTRAALSINQAMEGDRQQSLLVYREVQRAAWEAIEAGRAPAMLLGEIRQAQARIDDLLGLAPLDRQHPWDVVREFQSTVIGFIQDDAPEAWPALEARLRAKAKEHQTD